MENPIFILIVLTKLPLGSSISGTIIFLVQLIAFARITEWDWEETLAGSVANKEILSFIEVLGSLVLVGFEGLFWLSFCSTLLLKLLFQKFLISLSVRPGNRPAIRDHLKYIN